MMSSCWIEVPTRGLCEEENVAVADGGLGSEQVGLQGRGAPGHAGVVGRRGASGAADPPRRLHPERARSVSQRREASEGSRGADGDWGSEQGCCSLRWGSGGRYT